MRAILVRAFPLALFAALCEWIAIDLIRYAETPGWTLGGLSLSAAAVAAILGTVRANAPWHRASRAILAATFVGDRLLIAGIDVIPMIAFLVLLIVLASLQSLERTFGAVYDSVLPSSLMEKVDSAAVSAYARALVLAGFTFAVSILMVQLVPIIAVRGRGLLFVFGLALALLAVIASLALAPARPSRRRA